MKIPRYWARGTATAEVPGGDPVTYSLWRWSDESEEDARRSAEESARRIAGKFARGERLDRYSYGERPLREEALEDVKVFGGRTVAVITRNAYGALVLNAERVLFADIDFPGEPMGKAADKEEARHLAALGKWSEAHPGFGMRVYRTFGGLRCLSTSGAFDPRERSTTSLLESLGSDRLYVRLCRDQECFRARLTPKPWRCGTPRPPARWPFPSGDAERRFRDWRRGYEAASRDYGICRFVAHYGPVGVTTEAQAVLDAHDRFACASGALPLA